MSNLQQLDKQYIAGTYARFPVELVSGSGSLVQGSDGKSYIDLGSGIGVTAFGFADEEWLKAVTRQLGQLQHTSNLYYTEPCVRLAELLCQKTGMKKVFSCSLPCRGQLPQDCRSTAGVHPGRGRRHLHGAGICAGRGGILP